MNDSAIHADPDYADPMGHLRPPTTSPIPPSHRNVTAMARLAAGDFDVHPRQSGDFNITARGNENPDNPKDKFGAAKPCLSYVPPIALMHEAVVMKLGADKYGPFNWRTRPVKAKTYVDAAIRHLLQWADGEELDEQSRASHLAHARACCGILLDAQHSGNLLDDRHKSGFLSATIETLTQKV